MIQTLNREEWKQVQKYVCYEKTIYHFLKRINNVSVFDILFLDRYLGFDYHPRKVEPLLPYTSNFLNQIQQEFQVEFDIPIRQVRSFVKMFNKKNIYGQVELLTKFPNGVSMYTSVLIENFYNNTVFFTRTTSVESTISTPMPIADFIDSLMLNENNVHFYIWDCNSPIIKKLKNNSKKKIVSSIAKKYGYIYDGEGININEHKFYPNIESLYLLKFEVYRNRNIYLSKSVPPDKQLRLHKHIANKILPILDSWEVYTENDEIISNIKKNITLDLNNMYKWSSLLYSQSLEEYFEKYIQEFDCLIKDYNYFQKYVHDLFIEAIK